MKFKSEEHKSFYENKIAEYYKNGGNVDCYSKPFFYLMGLCRDTRNNLQAVFNMKERGIIVEGLHQGWQTGTSSKICRLAFNLWNGFCYENGNEDNEKRVSRNFSVDEIFCCEYAEYFFEAVRLRYPSYCEIFN